jgi:DNA-binding ferritin-like protein (Dps family)
VDSERREKMFKMIREILFVFSACAMTFVLGILGSVYGLYMKGCYDKKEVNEDSGKQK